MTPLRGTSRRTMLVTGASIVALLAGCSGRDRSAPTVGEFSYPDGSTQTGITGTTLFDTHQSTIEDADSFTVTGESGGSRPEQNWKLELTNKRGASGTLTKSQDSDGNTGAVWSPSGEQRSYGKLQSGSNTRYVINNHAPSVEKLAVFRRFQPVLSAVSWGEATDVIPIGEDVFAAAYESVGVSDETRLSRFLVEGAWENFTAAVAVAEAGFVHSLDYDKTVTRGNDTVSNHASYTVSALGTTTPKAPAWVETARKKGIQFRMEISDDGRGVTLEMVTGSDIRSGARLYLEDEKESASTQLTESVSVGDVLYVGLTEDGGLVTSREGIPDGARQLQGSAWVVLSSNELGALFRERRPL